MDEAALIARYFRDLGAERGDVAIGIGDDAAVLVPPAGMELVATTDTLVEGTHFLRGSAARSIGHRALAVNLSDCAAMGASPAWALLSLTLPTVDERWLAEFADGFGRLARLHGVALTGGNLCRGPLSVTVQLTGLVRHGAALRRSGARAGELLCLTGTAGDAAAGLAMRRSALAGDDPGGLCSRFEYPAPRVALGMRVSGTVTACIDISDGVYADIDRLAAASGCGAWLDVERLPLSPALTQYAGATAWQYALQGGEDYELGMAVPEARLPRLQALAGQCHTPLCCIGELRQQPGIGLRRDGQEIAWRPATFDHFAAE